AGRGGRLALRGARHRLPPEGSRNAIEGVRFTPRHDPCRPRLRASAVMNRAVVLVVAKAPVAGRAKTRLGREVGMKRAADLAAAALLDTVQACAAAYGPERCHLSLDGVLEHGQLADELLDETAEWTFHVQRGEDFGERLVNAHEDAAS